MKLPSKIIYTILTAAVFTFCWFVVFVIAAFGGAAAFILAMITAGFAAALLFVAACIWKLLKLRVRVISAAIAVIAMIVCVAAYNLGEAYKNGIEEIDERGVDLTLYEPFRDGTLAAELIEPPTLSLVDDLPILDGATALYPLYAAFTRALYPADYDEPENYLTDSGVLMPRKFGVVECTNTDGAYRRLIGGDADVIFAAGPSVGQLQMADEFGVSLELTPIGREAFVFFVNASNRVNGLSVADIRRIYSGEAANWREFGGKNAEIRAYQRPEDSGSQTALIKLMGDVPIMAPPSEMVAESMGGMVNTVSSYRNYGNAVGYSFLYFVTEMAGGDRIKLLALDGIEPTGENIANGTYPLASEFYAVTAGTKNPNARRLIEWILSEQGQYLVEATGYTGNAGR
jgi:phosphate transport system substrate-binding protein